MEQTSPPNPAPFGRRLAAALVDLVVLAGLMALAFVPLTFTRDFDQYVASLSCGSPFDEIAVGRFELTQSLVMLGATAAYLVACWAFGGGQTVGKRIVGLRVVRMR